MKRITLPGTDLSVPTVIAGMMRIDKLSGDADVRALVDAAIGAGIDFFDHANVYGPEDHDCESIFARALKWSPSEREQYILQTKAGIVRSGPYFDFSRDTLVAHVEGSLKALATDYIDILLLHRPDALVEPEEVARAFDELHAAGKVRHFGVSNHTPGQIELLRKYVKQPLVANQVQLAITHAPLVAQGVAMNMAALEQSVSRDLGLVDYCRLNDIALQAWSPFQVGFFTGSFIGDPEYPELNASLERIGGKYGVGPNAIATAWILRHPAQWQVVLGTTNPARVADSAAGADIELTRAEWYELYRGAGYLVP
ncbi:MAG: aldo/keto reductase [Propionibacteriaceae bacterium]|jgi:predicted oxidoreductase|nr:aldo/keto reductase [Propionibacteriaceae bacterium]